MKLSPNRVAVYLTAVGGLLTAAAPAVSDMDASSVGGLAAGFLGIAGVVWKWLDGWQKHEARTQTNGALEGDEAPDPGWEGEEAAVQAELVR